MSNAPNYYSRQMSTSREDGVIVKGDMRSALSFLVSCGMKRHSTLVGFSKTLSCDPITRRPFNSRSPTTTLGGSRVVLTPTVILRCLFNLKCD